VIAAGINEKPPVWAGDIRVGRADQLGGHAPIKSSAGADRKVRVLEYCPCQSVRQTRMDKRVFKVVGKSVAESNQAMMLLNIQACGNAHELAFRQFKPEYEI
jgi:hypothetical protein